MTLKEISKMANVSMSTVSKVINKKDSSISAETREKILDIVKQYHYSPYMDRSAEDARPSMIIGVLIGDSREYELLAEIVKRAQSRGYTTIVCTYSSREEELKNFKILLAHRADGIVWIKEAHSNKTPPDEVVERGVKMIVLDPLSAQSNNNFYFSFEPIGYAAAKSLVQSGHTNVGCVADVKNGLSSSFFKGFLRCLFDNNIPAEETMVLKDIQACDGIWLQSRTGIACFDMASLDKIGTLTRFLGIRIPQELSVVGINCENTKIDGAQISSINLPLAEFGGFVCDKLIDYFEKDELSQAQFNREYSAANAESIVKPKSKKYGKFVVLGTSNIDTLMSVDKQPESGETQNILHRSALAGGKGLNQAVGISRLGAKVSLISSIGNDYDGRRIFDCLKSEGVNTEGIEIQDDIDTGHAYIFIQKDAESNIAVFDGASAALKPTDFDRHEHLLENADYLLLQTEMNQELILHAAKTARKYGVKTILKPCATRELLPELYGFVDILVPNRKEAKSLLPDIDKIEDKAKEFQRRGAKTVIITLGHRGCFLLDGGEGRFFDAAKITPIDTTGAADAFIAALAVYLTEKKSITKSVELAICAGGLATTRHGVPPALADRETLELYYYNHQYDFRSKEK